MHLSVYAVLGLVTLFGLTAPRVAADLPAAHAVRLLTAGTLCAAVTWCAALGLLAFPLVGRLPALATIGRWSEPVLRRDDPVTTPVAAVALLAVVVLGIRTVRALVRRTAALHEANRLAALLPGGAEQLAVVDDPVAFAAALPGTWLPSGRGRCGRVVVTTGMLRALDPAGRRAVLAHERAHLDDHHHLLQAAVAVAATVAPPLRGVPAALELACERRADERAAAACSPQAVARALARVSTLPRADLPAPTARGGRPARGVALAAAGGDVAARLAALRTPARRQPWRTGAVALLVLAAAAATLHAAHDVEHLFELAQAAYPGGR